MDDEAGESLIIADGMLVRKGGEGRKRAFHGRDEIQFDWTFSGHPEAQWIRKSIKKSDLFQKMMAMSKDQKKD